MRLLLLLAVISIPFAVAVEEDGPICPAESSVAALEKSDDEDSNEGRTSPESKIEALIAWVRSLDGLVDDRIVIRRRNPTSVRGMFVTGAVAEGERLFHVPLDAIIYKEGGRSCDSARIVAKAMMLGEKSKYAPFISMLKDEIGDGAGPPCFWSDAGQELLNQVIGQHLPPQDHGQYLREWRQTCPDDVLPEEYVKLYSTRAVRHMLVPIFVLANHQNQANFRIDTNEQGFGAVTTRDIAKGEEVVYWYGLGTHNIFKNFGFVEQFPQRWVFDFGKGDGLGVDAGDYGYSGGHVVEFDLDEITDNVQESGGMGLNSLSFSVKWVKGGPPSKETINLLRSELVRLGTMRSPFEVDNTKSTGKVPKEEEELIWQYHRALTFAISHCIQSAG